MIGYKTIIKTKNMSNETKLREREVEFNELFNELDSQLNLMYENSRRLHRVSYSIRDHRCPEEECTGKADVEPVSVVDKLARKIASIKYHNSQMERDIVNLEGVV